MPCLLIPMVFPYKKLGYAGAHMRLDGLRVLGLLSFKLVPDCLILRALG